LSTSDRRLLSVAEVADATGLSANAVYRAIWAGELRATKLRGRLRVPVRELDAWVDSNLVCARGAHDEPPPPARPSGRNGPGRGLRELLEAE
jgi:excisionase family DNA binding protein